MPANIIHLTAAQLASWPTPNYVDPYHRKWMPGFAIFLLSLATLLSLTRFWVRFRGLAGKLGLDDLFLLIGWIGAILFTAAVLVTTERYHANRHAWDVPESSYVGFAHCLWLAEQAFLVSGCFTKVSVLLFSLRLVQGTNGRKWHWAVGIAVAFIICWTLATCLALVLACNPLPSYWESFSPTYTRSYHCVDTSVVNLLSGIFAASSDLYSVVLPCFMLYHHNVARPQRIPLMALFCLGLLIPVASVFRTYYLIRVEHASDFTWEVYNVYVWAQVETQFQIICACLPAMRGIFLAYIKPHLGRPAHGSRGSTAPHKFTSDTSGHGSTSNIVEERTFVVESDEHEFSEDMPRRKFERFQIESEPSQWAIERNEK